MEETNISHVKKLFEIARAVMLYIPTNKYSSRINYY